jgi:hypothetical protein
MKGIALAVLALPFCCAPVRADIIIGSSAQQVTLTNAGGGVIDVGIPTLSNADGGTPYNLTVLFAPSPFAFTQTKPNFFSAPPNAIEATVGTVIAQAGEYTDMTSNSAVTFDGVYFSGFGPNPPFQLTLTTLIDISGPAPPSTNILETLASDPVGTEWGNTIASGNFTTLTAVPEPSTYAPLMTIGLGVIALLRRSRKV